MNKQGGFAMSEWLWVSVWSRLVFLTIGHGGVTVGFSLSVDFQSFQSEVFIVVLIGAALIPGLPAVAKLAALALGKRGIADLHSHNARFGVYAYAHL